MDNEISSRSEAIESQSFIVNADMAIFILFIALLTAVNSLALLLVQEEVTRSLVEIFWWAGTIFLMIEVVVRLVRHENRSRMLTQYRGWIDVIGSLPIPFISLLRLWRAWWFVNRLQKQEIKDIQHRIVIRHARTTILAVAISAVIVLELGSILILRAEANEPLTNIHTPGDALWWSLVTMATVGYGDLYPVTPAGRLIGSVMIVTGVGLFTSLTSFMAHWFIVRRSEPGGELVNAPGSMPALQVETAKRLLEELANDPESKEREAVLAVIVTILESNRQKSGDSK